MDNELPRYLELDSKHNVIVQDFMNTQIKSLAHVAQYHEKELFCLWCVLFIGLGLVAYDHTRLRKELRYAQNRSANESR